MENESAVVRNMKKRRTFRIITALLILGVMTVIFMLSSQKAVESDKTSDSFITVLCRAVVSKFDSLSPKEKTEKVKSLSFVVRKAAHMTEFAVLGFLCAAFAASYGVRPRAFALAFGFSVFYAATDEFHQLFVEGRSGQLSDVCVDSVGILLGVAFAGLICLIIKRKEKAKILSAG